MNGKIYKHPTKMERALRLAIVPDDQLMLVVYVYRYPSGNGEYTVSTNYDHYKDLDFEDYREEVKQGSISSMAVIDIMQRLGSGLRYEREALSIFEKEMLL